MSEIHSLPHGHAARTVAGDCCSCGNDGRIPVEVQQVVNGELQAPIAQWWCLWCARALGLEVSS